MAWVARNSDNTPRTPSPYQRHDENNTPEGTGLLEENSYDRHDEDNVDEVNPGHTIATDAYGNQYRNWNADYVKHDVNNNPVV